MQTTTSWMRRLLGLLIAPAVLALPLIAAPAAFAQDGGDGGDEEDFYRQSDPEEPVAGVAEEGPKVYTISLSLRGLQFLDSTSQLDVERISMGIQGQWLWSPLDPENQINWEIGAEIGYQPFTSFSDGNISPTQWVEVLGDFDTGIEQATVNHPVMFIAVDLTTLYGAVASRVDFTGPSPMDLGASLSIGYALTQIEAEWNCKQCTGNPADVTNGGGDADVQNFLIRIGGFFSYQFKWFNIGFDLGWVYFAGGDLPTTMAIDFGIAFGIQF